MLPISITLWFKSVPCFAGKELFIVEKNEKTCLAEFAKQTKQLSLGKPPKAVSPESHATANLSEEWPCKRHRLIVLRTNL